MRRILSVIAVLAITGLSACAARQVGGTALIAGITNRPATAERTAAGSIQHSRRTANGTAPVDLPARTARKLPRHERGSEVAGTSGRIDANTSTEIAPASASAEPVPDSSTEKRVVETQLRQSNHPQRPFLRPLSIVLLIVAALVLTRRLF